MKSCVFSEAKFVLCSQAFMIVIVDISKKSIITSPSQLFD
jgi:hypothetical protein